MGEVFKLRVQLAHQVDFFVAAPAFELFLACDSHGNVFVKFMIEEAITAVVGCKAFVRAFPLLHDSL